MKNILKKLIILLIICITTVSCISISGCEWETETELFPIGVYDGENLLYTEYSEEEPTVGPMIYLYEAKHHLIGIFYSGKDYEMTLKAGAQYIVGYDCMYYTEKRGFCKDKWFERKSVLLPGGKGLGQSIQWEYLPTSEYIEFEFNLSCDEPGVSGSIWITYRGAGGTSAGGYLCEVKVTFE